MIFIITVQTMRLQINISELVMQVSDDDILLSMWLIYVAQH